MTGIVGMLLVLASLTLALHFPGSVSGMDDDGRPNVQAPAEPANWVWQKLVNDVAWSQGLIVTAETSDTIKIVDAVTTLPSESLELTESWNPDYLKLLDFQVAPTGTEVSEEGGSLTWELPEGGQVFTLTKWFHVEPCTWQETILVEELSTNQMLLERRAVPIQKRAPQLWIGSAYDGDVRPGDVTTLTLGYGNAGGYENQVHIRCEFPPTAPFASSIPSADDWGGLGAWALWLLGDLANGDQDEVIVTAAVQESAPPSTTIEIPCHICDHAGERRESEVVEFHVGSPPGAAWWKFVNGAVWDPQLAVAAETGDTVEVVDVVDSPRPFTLIESWNPAHLAFVSAHIIGGSVTADSGSVEWQVADDPNGPLTMTKQLRVLGDPWPATLIEETLLVEGDPEPSIRVIPLEHLLPPIDFPRGDWPWYAQEEITVWPEMPVTGQPTRICAEVINRDATQPHTVTLEIAVANFGIGVPFDPVGDIDLIVPAGGPATGCVVWVPPMPGHWCVEARLIQGQEDEPYSISQRNIDADEPLKPNIPHPRSFMVGNPFPHPVTITLGFVPHQPNWGLEFSQDVLPDMAPGEVRDVTLTVTPPDDLPPAGSVVVDVEAYVDGDLIGGFRKVFYPPIVLHRFPDPPYAEREITIHPYPPRAGEPTEICVELLNPSAQSQDVAVQFSWANFGIGLPFTPINGLRPVYMPPHSIVRECIYWVPPTGGHVCLEVELLMEGYAPQRSQRNLDVDEPLRALEPHARSFPVGNPLPHPVTITLGLVPHLPGWGLDLSPDILPDMAPGEVRNVNLIVTPPEELPPADTVVVDIEAHAGGELIGGFRKSFRPPITLHPMPDPPYAEREITVHPDPPLVGRPTELCVELRNPTNAAHDVQVQFSWAAFGIGVPFTPINGLRPVHLPPHSVVRECIHWIPPVGGHVCLQVELSHQQYSVQRSQRNIDIAELLTPGEADSLVFPVGNPLSEVVTVTLGLITYLPGWQIELSPGTLPDMAPGEVREVNLTVVPPAELPHDGDVVVEVEAYAQNRLIGGFRKAFRPPIPIHRPKDPIYAESEISIDPYPVTAGQPAKLGVELFNPTDQDQIVTVTFSVAHFGIGLPYDEEGIVPNPIRVFIPARGAARGHTVWNPPPWSGQVCVRVTLEMAGHERVWSQRNIDLGEPLRPGEPHDLNFAVGPGPHTEPVTVTLGLVPHRANWGLEIYPDVLTNVMPGQLVSATLTVVPPLGAKLGTGMPIVDVEGFVDGELLGGFRKLDIPPIPGHKLHEPIYAESEIKVDPYPPEAGQPTDVTVVLQNASAETATVEVTLGWADFGAGLTFTTTGMSPAQQTMTLSPFDTVEAEATWTPLRSGHQCLQVILTDPDGNYHPQRSQRNVNVADRPNCGTTKVFSFTLYNDSPFTVTIDLGLVTFNVPADWTVTTVPAGSVEIGPFSEAVIRVIVEIPCPDTFAAMRAGEDLLAVQEASNSWPVIGVEAYEDGNLIGGIEIQFGEPQERLIYLPLVLRVGP